MRLDGKRALVTGGSRGIGRAIVLDFVRRGARVAFGWAHDAKAASQTERLARKAGGTATAIRADLAVAGEPERLVREASAVLGDIDVLVNNAGIVDDAVAPAMTEAQWSRVLRVDLTAAFLAAKTAARRMLRRRSGCIVNVSSIVAALGGRGQANYAAAKGGLEALTRALAVDLAPRDIRVNCVAPGFVDTDMTRRVLARGRDRALAPVLLRRPARPEEIAAVVSFLASDLASYVTGEVVRVDGGLGLGS